MYSMSIYPYFFYFRIISLGTHIYLFNFWVSVEKSFITTNEFYLICKNMHDGLLAYFFINPVLTYILS